MELELSVEFDNRTQLNFDFIWQKDKRHPVSTESERSPSSMYLNQFDKTKFSINPELTKFFIAENNEKFQKAIATPKR